MKDDKPTWHAPRKLDIACGQNKKPGFKGIDLSGDADIVHDLFTFPWPIKTSSVSEMHMSHFAEHIPHKLPGVDKDGFFAVFEEVHRIGKDGATITIIHPFLRSDRAFFDPTHERFISDTTWHYLTPEFREVNRLEHYTTTADFEIVVINHTGPPEMMTLAEEQKNFRIAHYWNVVADLEVTLRIRKSPGRRK